MILKESLNNSTLMVHVMDFNSVPDQPTTMSFTSLNFAEQRQMASVFDRNLDRLRSKTCEPSLLGGGTKAKEELDALLQKSTELLEEARALNDDGYNVKQEKSANCREIKIWFQEVQTALGNHR